MLRFNFLPKFSIVIILAFILFTILGTLSHEIGHIVVAKYFGYDTTLDYGSMNYFPKGYLEDENLKAINLFVEEYDYNNYENWPEKFKLKVEELREILQEKYPPIEESHTFWITIGGPTQTLLTSIIGLFVLSFRRNKWRNGFKFLDWLAVFMSLFALREVFNFITALYSFLVYTKSNFHGDEFRISRYLGFNEWIIPSLTLALSVVISFWVIFKCIPTKYRFSFIISGLFGGVIGFIFWYDFLGEILF